MAPVVAQTGFVHLAGLFGSYKVIKPILQEHWSEFLILTLFGSLQKSVMHFP